MNSRIALALFLFSLNACGLRAASLGEVSIPETTTVDAAETVLEIESTPIKPPPIAAPDITGTWLAIRGSRANAGVAARYDFEANGKYQADRALGAGLGEYTQEGDVLTLTTGGVSTIVRVLLLDGGDKLALGWFSGPQNGIVGTWRKITERRGEDTTETNTESFRFLADGSVERAVTIEGAGTPDLDPLRVPGTYSATGDRAYDVELLPGGPGNTMFHMVLHEDGKLVNETLDVFQKGIKCRAEPAPTTEPIACPPIAPPDCTPWQTTIPPCHLECVDVVLCIDLPKVVIPSR